MCVRERAKGIDRINYDDHDGLFKNNNSINYFRPTSMYRSDPINKFPLAHSKL